MDQTTATPISLLDAYAPAQIALRVREVGVAKAAMPVLTMFALAVLAGAFIALGALFYTVTMTTRNEVAVPFDLLRLEGGVTFSLGLVLVVGGAELFTGNNLIAMAWASRSCDDTTNHAELGMSLSRQLGWSSWNSGPRMVGQHT